MYEQYEQLKIRLEECAENLATLTSELAAEPNLQTQTRTALERLRAERFVALIVGNFNVGKSTLINALVGEKILPTSPIPKTAVFCAIRYGEEKKITMYPKSGEPFEIDADELDKYVSIERFNERGEIDSPYKRVEITRPFDWGKNNVELIDSVGLDDPDGRDLIALGYAKNADAILYLTPCARAASVGELETLDLLKAQGCENLFFIATHADAIRGDKEEEREHKKYFERQMAGRTELGKAGIFYVDSRAALRGREKGDERAVAESGILEIEAGLEKFLVSRRGRDKILTNVRGLRGACDEVEKVIQTRRDALDMKREEFAQIREDAWTELPEARKRASSILWNVNLEVEGIANECATATLNFLRELDSSTWTDGFELNARFVIPTKEKVKKAVEETCAHLKSRFERELSDFARTRLAPTLARRLRNLEAIVNEEGRRFDRRFPTARASLIGEIAGNVSKDGDFASQAPPMWERAARPLTAWGDNAVFVGETTTKAVAERMATTMIDDVSAVAVAWPTLTAAILTGAVYATIAGSGVGASGKVVAIAGRKFGELMRDAAEAAAQQLRSKIEAELKRTVDALEKALRDDVEKIERETQRQKTEGNEAQFQEKQRLARCEKRLSECRASLAQIGVATIALG